MKVIGIGGAVIEAPDSRRWKVTLTVGSHGGWGSDVGLMFLVTVTFGGGEIDRRVFVTAGDTQWIYALGTKVVVRVEHSAVPLESQVQIEEFVSPDV